MILSALTHLALAGVVLSDVPQVDNAVEISLTTQDGAPRSGVPVRVVMQPDLHGEHELAVGITDANGVVAWTPTEAGRVKVRGGPEQADVIVAGLPNPQAPMLLVALLVLTAVIGRNELRKRT